MTTTVSTQDQLAASRMLCARLHVALTLARDLMGPIEGPGESHRIVVTNEARAEIDAALEHSEPEIHALRTDAERAAREARRLADARTHGARVQAALMALAGEVSSVPLTVKGQYALEEAMKVLAQSGDTAQLVDDIRYITGTVLASNVTDELKEPAQRIIDAFGPGA